MHGRKGKRAKRTKSGEFLSHKGAQRPQKEHLRIELWFNFKLSISHVSFLIAADGPLKNSVSMTLRLEYICTEAELKEAQNLNIRRQCGSGPKWRSLLVYWALIALIFASLVVRFITEVTPQNRVWFIPMTIILTIVILFALQYYNIGSLFPDTLTSP